MLGKKLTEYLKQANESNPGLKKGMRYFRLMFRISEEIQTMRKSVGLTQKQLASLLNTTQSTVASWEIPGYDGYTVKKLFSISEELGYTVNVIFYQVPTVTEQTPSDWFIDGINQEMYTRKMSSENNNIYTLNKLTTIEGNLEHGETYMVNTV
ncbi:MAG TPA: helix-turn-helix domain-containing protein [Candidatus Saccharimonadales bacterium]|nr:helix-turn-helix domain-containing protein [Candidatus Saccharimonadales bacterium]